MADKVAKRVVFISGASGEIGSIIAKKFAENGDDLVLHFYKNQDAVEKLKSEFSSLPIRVLTVQGDLSKGDDVRRIFSEVFRVFSHVDVVINNAGISQIGLIQDATEEDFDRIFGVNTKSAFLVNNAVLPSMISKKSGCIVQISSMWGARGASCETLYSASKAALIGYSRALAKEVGPSGIRVNTVLPGVIETKMNAHLSKDELNRLADGTALCRLGTPEDVADTVFYLCSPEASFITGTEISVDGGFIG